MPESKTLQNPSVAACHKISQSLYMPGRPDLSFDLVLVFAHIAADGNTSSPPYFHTVCLPIGCGRASYTTIKERNLLDNLHTFGFKKKKWPANIVQAHAYHELGGAQK